MVALVDGAAFSQVIFHFFVFGLQRREVRIASLEVTPDLR